MKRRSNGEGSIFHDKKRNHYVVRLTYEDSLGIKNVNIFMALLLQKQNIKQKNGRKLAYLRIIN